MLKQILKKLIPERLIDYCWHLPNAILANLRYGFPARKLMIVGIAGTKGKTTTAYLTAQLLELHGYKTALFSTAVLAIAGKESLNTLKMTTPSAWFLQKLLRDARSQNCTHAVLEVSSHGIKQFRVWGIPFHVAVITNLAPDHLEYHKTPADYHATHFGMISRATKTIVLNNDDPHCNDFKKLPKEIVTFGKKKDSDIEILTQEPRATGYNIAIQVKDKTYTLDSPLKGSFNVMNLVASLSAIIKVVKAPLEDVSNYATQVKSAPGRFEEVNHGGEFSVIVDYAHSPESFENILQELRPTTRGNLIVVTGACGDRDPTARPKMGEIIAQYADSIVITNDDPYTEDPEKIARELIAGILPSKKFREEKNFWKILDRKQAIEYALSLARKGDTVAILGKGAEQWQVFKDKKIPWDDRAVARNALVKK